MTNGERTGADSYYGRPILKQPVWKPEVAWYLFTGGLAGASASLSLAARLTGNRSLARTSSRVSITQATKFDIGTQASVPIRAEPGRSAMLAW